VRALVGPELADRVLRAAKVLRYVSNAPAQALARSTSTVVGLIVHAVDDPYFSAIAAGAMRVAAERDLLTMMASTFRDPEREIDYVSRLRAHRARGVLLVGSGFTATSITDRLHEEISAFVAGGGRVACIGEHSLRSIRCCRRTAGARNRPPSCCSRSGTGGSAWSAGRRS